MLATYALNGDQWSTPASTLVGFWSALGAGAQGLTLTVLLTQDKQLVCAPENSLSQYTGVDAKVSELTLAQLQQLDAGACWRSTVLNKDGQPTGVKGNDTPWVATNDWQRLYFPELALVLQTFSRRTQLQLILPASDDIILPLMDLLQTFALAERVELITASFAQQALIKKINLNCICIFAVPEQGDLSSFTELAGFSGLYLSIEQLYGLPQAQFEALKCMAEQEAFKLYLTSQTMPYSFSPQALGRITKQRLNISAIISKGALPSVEITTKPGVVFSDNFQGKTENGTQWAIGYSHANDDTHIDIDNALIINIKQGGHYSGGAAVMKIATHGNFDAQVDFDVAHPHQGTTFELAAISIDPSYKATSLTFDVHGAPPYASSERDEDDGFRCGWNNSFTVTDFVSTSQDIQTAAQASANYPLYGEPYSSNAYNCYGRDVGYGKADSSRGQLRLIRHGQVFNTYYRDGFNQAWVCSGAMLVQNMPQDVFIRLAAKHWKKKNPEPPYNKVTFNHFQLKQY